MLTFVDVYELCVKSGTNVLIAFKWSQPCTHTFVICQLIEAKYSMELTNIA